ncbi:MAG: twin-arginine translocation signal domain-containing protein, partial [Acidithiobacillus sp.]
MNRRGFLLTSAGAGAAALLSPVLGHGATAEASYATFPQSYVVEFRVTPPQQQAV